MRYYYRCYQCHREGLGNVLSTGDITNDLFILLECPNKHKMVFGISNNLFEILYNYSVDSFIRGYYTQSVSTFASSLERTYEFFVKASLIEEGISMEKIDQYWKEIKKQSERQYGSFCSQFLKISGSDWHSDTKLSNFRNEVIHNGYIASKEETYDYANYTTNQQTRILQILKEKIPKSTTQLKRQLKSNPKNFYNTIQKENASMSFGNIPSLLDCNNIENFKLITFDDAIKTMMIYNKKYFYK